VSSNSSDVVGSDPIGDPVNLPSGPTHPWKNYRCTLLWDSKDRSHILKVVHKSRAASLPPSADLSCYVPYVPDQLQIGSCASEASCSAIRIWEMKQQSISHIRPAVLFYDVSPMFNYFNARLVEGEAPTDDGGSTTYDAIRCTKQYGVASLQTCPYLVDQMSVQPNAKAYAEAGLHRTSGYFAVAQNAVSLKSYLAQGYPLVGGFCIYSSFMSDSVAKTGIVPLPDVTQEDYVGGHALLLVAYDDSKSQFKALNSWSSLFGMGGYVLLPYDYVLNTNLASQFFAISGLAFSK